MPYVTRSHSKVHYEIDGRGPGLALVHGVGGDAEKVFGNIVEYFSHDRTVVRPNLSGSGQTTDDGSDLTVDQVAEQVSAAITDAVEGPVDLLGFSLGGGRRHSPGTGPQAHPGRRLCSYHGPTRPALLPDLAKTPRGRP
jgi:pimeloyl-ACP methyl ester carboxylesterase